MRTNSQLEQISKVLAVCKDRWRLGGVPEYRVDEMGDELEQHLRESVADGQKVEEVVGDDVLEFAEEWGEPNQPRKPAGHEILEMLAATGAFMFIAVLAVHLWQGSTNLPVSWEALSFFVVLAYAFSMLFSRLRRPSGVDSNADVSVWDAYPGWLQVGILSAAILALAYDRFMQSTEQVIFTWPWPATAALLLASPGLLLLKKVITGKPLEAYDERLHNERLHDEDQYLYGFLKPQEEIESVVKDCVFYWRTDTRIPADQAKEMGEELEQHLWDAVEDGKTVESVVGFDVDKFAEEWAEEDRPAASAANRAVEIVFGISAFFTIAAGLGHFLGWELYVPILWFPLLLSIGVASWLLRMAIGLTRQPQTGSIRMSWLLTAGAVLLATGLAAGIAFALFGVREAVPLLASLRWPWYATLASTTVATLMIFVWTRE